MKTKKTIEQEIGIDWGKLSDNLGRVTWVALLDTLAKITMETADKNAHLALGETNTFVHYHVTMGIDMIISGNSLDPANPQIDEFQPGIELNMVVDEHEKKDQGESAT